MPKEAKPKPPPGAYTPGLGALKDVSLSGVAQGDLFYRGASLWNNLPHGVSGQVLQTNGAAANPTWTTSVLGNVTLTPASSARNIVQPTGDFVNLPLVGFVGQTAAFLNTKTSGGTLVHQLYPDGSIFVSVSGSTGLHVAATADNAAQLISAISHAGGQYRFVAQDDGNGVTIILGSSTQSTDIPLRIVQSTGQTVESLLITNPEFGNKKQWAVDANNTVQGYRLSSTSVAKNVTSLYSEFLDNTNASWKGRGRLTGHDVNGEREAFRWEADGAAGRIAWFGGAAVVQQANASQAAITAVLDPNAKSALQAIYNLLSAYTLAPATA